MLSACLRTHVSRRQLVRRCSLTSNVIDQTFQVLQETKQLLPEVTIQIPRIVVIGSTSSGKTSVLSHIIGEHFLKRSRARATYRPCEINLRSISPKEADKTPKIQFGLKNKQHNLYDSRVEDKLAQLQGTSFSHIPFNITVDTPNAHAALLLVDMPGFVHTDEAETMEVVRIVKQYVDKNCILLCVHAANQAPDMNFGFSLLEPDQEGMIVLTKLDLEETRPVKWLFNELTKQTGKPICGVVCRDTEKRADNWNELQEITNKHGYELGDQQLGFTFLIQYLNKQLLTSIHRQLPTIKSMINKSLQQAQQNKAALQGTALQTREHWANTLRAELIIQLMRKGGAHVTQFDSMREMHSSFVIRLLPLIGSAIEHFLQDDYNAKELGVSDKPSFIEFMKQVWAEEKRHAVVQVEGVSRNVALGSGKYIDNQMLYFFAKDTPPSIESFHPKFDNRAMFRELLDHVVSTLTESEVMQDCYAHVFHQMEAEMARVGETITSLKPPGRPLDNIGQVIEQEVLTLKTEIFAALLEPIAANQERLDRLTELVLREKHPSGSGAHLISTYYHLKNASSKELQHHVLSHWVEKHGLAAEFRKLVGMGPGVEFNPNLTLSEKERAEHYRTYVSSLIREQSSPNNDLWIITYFTLMARRLSDELLRTLSLDVITKLYDNMSERNMIQTFFTINDKSAFGQRVNDASLQERVDMHRTQIQKVDKLMQDVSTALAAID